MFCYQKNFFCPTEVVTPELFSQLIIDDHIVKKIKAIRALRAEIAAEADENIIMEKSKEADRLKRQLPAFIFQATFDKSISKSEREGAWVKQHTARLNGLYMLDIDHVDDPLRLFNQWVSDFADDHADFINAPEWVQRNAFCQSLDILLVHVTSSGHGLRLVAIANAQRGNLVDNQQWLTQQLGCEFDKSCKDASRRSFCPMFDDILFINKEKLFTYEDKVYDQKFGEMYRGGDSRPTSVNPATRVAPADAPAAAVGQGAQRSGAAPAGCADGDDRLGRRIEEGYHGIPYSKIISVWFDTTCGGAPAAGDRHASLYRLACDLRYVCDFDPKLLARLLEECEVGRQIVDERGADEIQRIAGDACALQRYRAVPKRFTAILEAAGVQLEGQAADDAAGQVAKIDYDYWWHRLEPLLSDSPGYREAVATLPDHHKIGGVLAAGAMLGTYLTRCWWEHFDGKDYRLSFLVYIVGGAASGKSFVIDMDRLIMNPMLTADREGREWERQYKEEMKRRSASSRDARAKAPEQEHPVIRYVPSTISNAMLYRRLTDAVDKEHMGPDGQPIHLHCYTCEAELATALRVQQGSWAGKLDLETKSFQNEVAGVDYANDQSTNGIIQINWNQVISGTTDAMSRKIKPGTVLDGLVTRLCIFPMPSNDFAMIERRKAHHDYQADEYLRTIGLKLEEINGCLGCERLVDFCYDYECQLTKEAELEEDHCLDYFRKRIPLIMIRYTLVRMVLRALQEGRQANLITELEVTDSDLEFAKLIGDFCLMSQMRMFGQMVMDAMENEDRTFIPRIRSNKIREIYSILPENFKTATLVEIGYSKSLNSAHHTVKRWVNDGLVEVNRGTYKKLFKDIPF